MERLIHGINPADSIKINHFGDTVKVPPFSRIFLINLTSSNDVDNFISAANELDDIEYAEKNFILPLASDPDYSKQWYFNNTGQSFGGNPGSDIKAELGWQIYTGNPNIKIGVLDDGVQLNHPDLIGRISGDGVYGTLSHGTRVAGIIGAIWDNSIGIKGINKYSPIISDDGIIQSEYVGAVQGVYNLTLQGVKVINHSYGTAPGNEPTAPLTLRMAFSYATAMGIINVGVTHNQGIQYTSQPGCYQGVIAVGSSQNNDLRSLFSNYGNHIDVVAPGGYSELPIDPTQNIWTTTISSTYQYTNGTSFAAPQVTGLASLIQGYYKAYYNNYLDVDDMRGIIINSADKVRPLDYSYVNGFNIQMGYGRINVRKALDLIRSPYEITKSPIITGGGTSNYLGSSYNFIVHANGLSNWIYSVKKYEVTRTINYSLPYGATEKYIWGNGRGVTGWSLPDPDAIAGNLGFCEVVSGSVTSNSFTLRTYVYEVWTFNPSGGTGEYKGWYPATPQNTTFGYTILWKNPIAIENGFTGDSLNLSNFPNPFNPTTKIKFNLKSESNVKLVIYDITGREIKTLMNEYKYPGVYSIDFDGSNLASGVYFYKLLSENNVLSVKKMLLVK